MIKLYYCRWTESDIETVLQLSKYISEERLHKLNKYLHKEDKVRSILAELLLKYALKEDNKNFVQPSINEFGKPYIDGVHFSISHSGNMVVLGYGDSEIGVDIELVQGNVEMIDSIFTSYENQFVFCGANEEIQERFVQMWTMKESLLKMMGVGLGTDLREYEVVQKGSIFGAKIHNRDTKINIISQKLEEDYYLALCSEDSKVDRIRCSMVEIIALLLG